MVKIWKTNQTKNLLIKNRILNRCHPKNNYSILKRLSKPSIMWTTMPLNKKLRGLSVRKKHSNHQKVNKWWNLEKNFRSTKMRKVKMMRAKFNLHNHLLIRMVHSKQNLVLATWEEIAKMEIIVNTCILKFHILINLIVSILSRVNVQEIIAKEIMMRIIDWNICLICRRP